MSTTVILNFGKTLGVTLFLAASLGGVGAWQPPAESVATDGNVLEGIVIGPNGAEAGV